MQERGFTLLELSVVLAIVGLMAGGVMMGRGLIHSAELNAVVTEYQTYSTAVKQFREKYGALPGDMPNAEDVWGNAGVGCTATPGSELFRTGTCNGNGDGIMDRSGAFGSSLRVTSEGTRAWQQLALAGLVGGTYSGRLGYGTEGALNISVTPGISIPNSRLNGASWALTSSDHTTYASTTYFYHKDYTNNMVFAAVNPAYGELSSSVLTPRAAFNMDTKLDDGKPGKGKIVAFAGVDKCATSANADDFNGEYRVNANGKLCALFFDYLDIRQGR